MQVIVVREPGQDCRAGRMSLLQYALSTAPLNHAVVTGLYYLGRCPMDIGKVDVDGGGSPEDVRWVLPRQWHGQVHVEGLDPSFYDPHAGGMEGFEGRPTSPWSLITNGRFATCINYPLLVKALASVRADVIAVNAAPDLRAYREGIRTTPNNELVGYRRLYTDSVSPMPVPDAWPHHLLVRREAFDLVLGQALSEDFAALADRCRAEGVRMQGMAVAGSVFDLESGEGILAVCRAALKVSADPGSAVRPDPSHAAGGRRADDPISNRSRIIGPVLLGDGVTVEPGAVIVGPSVLCDHSTIGRDAIVDLSIVGAEVSVAPGEVLRNCLVAAPEPHRERVVVPTAGGYRQERGGTHREDAFRLWPKSPYARFIKRAADVCAATIVLALFVPVVPVIALAIKLSSPGPVFFRDKRQGLRGELFDCIKFRTMRRGADKMQEKLRFVSEVDGPQFKMADDPRITTVGRFLRETYLDEIPQFFNVLCGQMSVVGPRPSPESENTLCPSWRDARLSVRPGITGLWQIFRTRVAHKDFQEWIQYDMQYVRELSFGLDLWIGWRTFKRMMENFVNQF
jgi:lipopolysaccharide/colanic/teichoic acid biosynthesis glycosyltransferase